MKKAICIVCMLLCLIGCGTNKLSKDEKDLIQLYIYISEDFMSGELSQKNAIGCCEKKYDEVQKLDMEIRVVMEEMLCAIKNSDIETTYRKRTELMEILDSK